MALTMTRTRTQTTLTKLVTQLARVNGELVALSLEPQTGSITAEIFESRRNSLERQREALVLTLRQFDPLLDVSTVGSPSVLTQLSAW